MKKIFLYILLTFTLMSCEDMLEETPKDFVSRSNYYKNEADAIGALNGAYQTLGTDFYRIESYVLVELQGDFITGRGSQASVSNVQQILDQQNISRVNITWATLYEAVNRSNAVLNNVPLIEDISEETRQRILAEARFLRALAYFELVRGWGAVPLKTEESTDLSALEAKRVPVETIYNFIIEDLLAAEEKLPVAVGDESGRASIWAAKMLLAHVYLTTEKWESAAKKADEVINNGGYSLVTVEEADDFYKIFASTSNTEDIMSVHHADNRQSWIQTYIHRGNTYPYNYSSNGYYAWIPNTTSFIGEAWDDDDLRKAFNLYSEYQDSEGAWVPLPETTPVLFKKFVTDSEGRSIYNIPIYRYTEAFLFYAEASCRATGAPSALALERLNMIRRRAYGYDPAVASPVDYPSGMGQEEFIDAVLQERAYEFLLEKRRWWDLKRTGRVKEAFTSVGKTFIDERYLWPIPEDEINNNPAISQEDQNPGY